MKSAVVVAFLSAVFLTGCATRNVRPCPVPPAPALKPTPVAAAPAPVVETPVAAPVAVVATPAPAPAPAPDYAAMFKSNVNDVYFDFDKSNLRSDAQTTLAADITFLKANPNILFSLTGSCDVVGSDAYNDELAGRRLSSVTHALTLAGIGYDRFTASSLGKTSSYCSAKSCQQLNRRVHFAFSGTR